MGTLKSPDGKLILLRSHHLLGRSRAMHTTLQFQDISAQHAAIAWTAEGWVVRDLGSRNGTWADDRRLTIGENTVLVAGTTVSFGEPGRRFTVISDAPPTPSAVSGSQIIEGTTEFLALPDADDPVALVTFEPDEGWMISIGADSSPLRDGQAVTVGDESWTIVLPELLTRTQDRRRAESAPSGVAMRFSVSSDEEYVELTVVVDGEEHALKPRSHHYILLLLARARLDDLDSPESEQGWLYTGELAKMLRASRNQLYVSLYRARKGLAAIGIENASELIERRPTTQQLRLGLSDITVTAL
jgi:hypothetical protein